MGMKNEKKGFFSRMLSSEHKIFETSMFGISVVLTLALVIGIGYYISIAFFNSNTVTDEEANASAVSDSAVTVRESPEPTQTPDGNTMIREDDIGTQVDEDLAKATEGYTTSTVNMRSEPSLTASVVTKVPASTKLTFSGLQKKEWMEVEYNGQKGYINAMYLSVDKPKPIETVTPRPTQTPAHTTAVPKATKTPKATKKPKSTKSPKTTKTPKATKTPDTVTPAPTHAPTEAPTAAPTQAPTQAPTVEPTANTAE